ncbi:hypothetical protein DPEC_G00378970 [Dallia pectoralis]|nr:hypothetical protein DPEC_G00378970 [Dallia pectoralis]
MCPNGVHHVELSEDAAGITFELPTPKELVLMWTKVHSSVTKRFQLETNDSVRLWYSYCHGGVETNKHFIELRIKKFRSEDICVFIESLHTPVVFYCDILDPVETGNGHDIGKKSL